MSGSSSAHFTAAGAGPQGDLRRKSARGAALTLAGQAAKLLIQVGSMAILARLLTPQDFGLIAMTIAVTGFLTVFSDLGLSAATVQRDEINHRQISTIFWLNAAMGAGLTLLTAAIAPALAHFYHEPRLTSITIALGLGFLISGLGVQHRAFLKRQMRFAALTSIEISSGFAAAVVGLVLAFLHFGYASLVVAQLAMVLTGTVLAWVLCGWRPGLPVRHSGVRSMVAFGGNLTVFSVLNYGIRNLDNVLIGWRWGPHALGLYARAYQLLLFPLAQIISPLGSVAVPALSRLQHDPERYRGYYLRCVNVLAYLTIPMTIAFGVFSDEIVFVLLGPQWHAASTIFRILAISSIFQPVASTTGWVYTSLNRTKIMAKWGVLASAVILPAFAIGLPWGPTGVALAYCIAYCIIVYPSFVIAFRGTPISIPDLARAIRRPMTLGAIAAVVMFLCRYLFLPLGILPMFAISALVLALLLALLIRFWPAARLDMRRLVEDASMIWRR
jgi:PST family polysaccharide transporter